MERPGGYSLGPVPPVPAFCHLTSHSVQSCNLPQISPLCHTQTAATILIQTLFTSHRRCVGQSGLCAVTSAPTVHRRCSWLGGSLLSSESKVQSPSVTWLCHALKPQSHWFGKESTMGSLSRPGLKISASLPSKSQSWTQSRDHT